jgi:hypothetical protein
MLAASVEAENQLVRDFKRDKKYENKLPYTGGQAVSNEPASF